MGVSYTYDVAVYSIYTVKAVHFNKDSKYALKIYIISPGDTVHGGVPEVIFKMKRLESLDLSYTGINCLPDIASELFTLQTLNLEHCPFLESVSGNLGLLPNLRSKFRQVPFFWTITLCGL